MPKPRVGETKDNFIQRCIPKVLDDGTTNDPKQASAICNSIYDTEAYHIQRAKRIRRLKMLIKRLQEKNE